jgi:hypothetical protein
MKMKIVNFVYLATSIVGALLIAANIQANLIGYVLFLISSILGAYLVTISNASRSLLIVNIVFAIINVIGIVRHL